MAVAGAGLAGLVTGAILARQGMHVIVVDGPDRIGGRGGSTPHRDYWLDGGQRDGADVGDLQVGWRYGQIAAREAGVNVPLRVVEPVVRVHHLPESRGEARVVDGRWGAKGFLQLARDGFGCPEEQLPGFGAVLAKIASATPEERRAAIPVSLGEWTREHVPHPEVRRALLTMVTVVYCQHPERASVGRLMGFLAPREDLPPLETAFPDHPEIGGMQGLMAPWHDAIESSGGRVLLGLEPREVTFDAARANGVVAVDESHLALEIRAHRVVIAAPLWQALPLLPPERVAPELLALARALEDEQADAVCWQAGLTRLPRLRATGEPESHVGWNRVLVGPTRRYLGGYHLPSLASRCAAPPGRHLLHAFIARWLARDERIAWSDSRVSIDRVVEHLHRFYLDLDACIEWCGYQAIARPACLAWYWSPVVRHGVEVPGCDGVFLASTTFESEAGPVDIAAHAGLEAARAISASFERDPTR